MSHHGNLDWLNRRASMSLRATQVTSIFNPHKATNNKTHNHDVDSEIQNQPINITQRKFWKLVKIILYLINDYGRVRT